MVCRGSWPIIRVCGFINRKASITTFPLTDCMGSTTTATARGVSCSKDCCVFISTEDSQQPKPGCEWYHPTTVSGLCLSQIYGQPACERGHHEPACLPEHVHHLCLKYRINSLHTDTGSALRHSKYIYYPHRIIVDKLSQHQAHNFHRHTSSTMPQHLEQSKGGDVYSFGVIDEIGVLVSHLYQ